MSSKSSEEMGSPRDGVAAGPPRPTLAYAAEILALLDAFVAASKAYARRSFPGGHSLAGNTQDASTSASGATPFPGAKATLLREGERGQKRERHRGGRDLPSVLQQGVCEGLLAYDERGSARHRHVRGVAPPWPRHVAHSPYPLAFQFLTDLFPALE